MSFVPVNEAAVALAALSGVVLGAMWYGPLFGTQWTALMQFDPAETETMKKRGMGGMWKSYVAQLGGSLLTAYALSHFLYFAANFTHRGDATSGMIHGFWAWLGFMVPVMLTAVLWEGKPTKLFWLNAGYYLVSVLTMGAIIGGMGW